MKNYCKRIVALVLALAMTLVAAPVTEETVYAGDAAYGSTSTIDTPVESTVNAEVYFVSAATGKYISLDGVNGNPIQCTTTYDGETSVKANGIFTIYYATATSGGFPGTGVVNFTSEGANTSWASNGNEVYQIAKRTNPNGWESVIMEAQGDGTVAFKNNNNGKYLTLSGDVLSVTDSEVATSNEKFIPYTTTAPKTAKNVTLANISGDSITVTWNHVSETIYGGYEVLYSTEEEGTYTSAGITGENKLVVSGLDLNTRYYFKVRTFVNTKGGAYSDSKVCYASTLKDYKPSKVSGVEVEETDEGLSITWDEANSATTYKVYRAVSRYAEYREVGTTTTNSFVDKNPNVTSRYHNYYKVQGVNSEDMGEMSEPGSLEISMFGLNSYIFNETDNVTEVNNTVAKIFDKQHYSQFGSDRYALMYKPGDYTDTATIDVGYYTQVLGLGKTPYDVKLNNVNAPAALSGGNATCNFWVGIENVTIADTVGANADFWFDSFRWAVSQAAPARRLNVERLSLFQWTWDESAWSSGGYIADSIFHQQAGSYTQQQYYYRNCELLGGVYGVNWNQLIQGCEGFSSANSSDNSQKEWNESAQLINGNGYTNWAARGCTTVLDVTDKVREKPFLYFDVEEDKYKVFIPAMRENSSGVSWSQNNMGEGTSISVEHYFYVAKPTDKAADINYWLDRGRNVIFSPGIYHLEEPLRVKYADTVLLGLGIASLIPDNEESAIIIDDVGGVSVAGIILDAGNYSKTLLRVGEEGDNKDHSENPTVLQDVIYRVGGTGSLGRTDSCQVINSNDVIIDHTWIWRADHGDHVGWYENTAKNGLVVNGDNVTTYGLFCEHFQEYDIIWRGENGKTYFLQNEKCYDPQDQAGWMSHDGTKLGYAAYKVANNVKNHYAVAMGIYDVFINTNGASIYLDNAIEVPNTPGVLIENACIVEIANGSGPKVGINHIVNNTTAGIRTGADNNGGYAIQRLLSYNNRNSISLPDYYEAEADTTPQVQVGETPSDDADSEKDIVKDPSSKDDEIPLWEMTEKDFDDKFIYCESLIINPPVDGPEDKPGTSGGNQGGNNNVQKPTNNGNGSVSTKYDIKLGEEFIVGKYKYVVTSISDAGGTVTVKGLKDAKRKKTVKKINIKNKVTYKTCPLKVTKIANKAFAKCKKVKSVKIGNNVKVIPKKAFLNCKKIKTVTLGKKVKNIKAKAFAKCNKIKTIKLTGKKLKKVAKNAFTSKVKKSVKITGKKKSVKKMLKAFKRTK